MLFQHSPMPQPSNNVVDNKFHLVFQFAYTDYACYFSKSAEIMCHVKRAEDKLYGYLWKRFWVKLYLLATTQN